MQEWTGYFNNKIVDEYSLIIEQCVRAQGASLIDVRAAFLSTDYLNLLSDGLHPNAKGHEVVANTVRAHLISEGYLGLESID